jgi:4-amino-4-deoxy-L-arabinose transferase-like glycosyltransferase
VVFFNFIVFWGHYWLFSLLAKEFPGKRRLLLLLIFFFPPVVFWLSGIRADGLLLFFVALILVHYHRWLQQRKGHFLLYTILAMAGLFIFRNMMPLMMVPPMIAWLIAVRWKRNPWLIFAMVYAITGLLFFSTAWWLPRGGLPAVVVKRQQEYFTLKGNTAFALDSLQASAGSFIKVLPQAVNNTFLRPFLWEAKDKLQLMASLDNMFLWGLIILFLVRKDEQLRQKWRHPLILFFLFFSISLYLFIGYTVPFPGAIIRYKAIAELCILLSLSVGIKWGGNLTYYK